MFPKGESIESEVFVNSIWTKDDLIASKRFDVLKDADTYRKERRAAADAVLPIFIKDLAIKTALLDSLNNYNVFLLKELDNAISSTDKVFKQSTFLTNSSFQEFKTLRSLENILSTNVSISLNEFFMVSKRILQTVYAKGILDQKFDSIEKDSIAVRNGKFEREFPKNTFYDMNEMQDFTKNFYDEHFSKNPVIQEAAVEYILHFIQPDLIYSQYHTELAKETAMNKVSRNVGIVNENERIVAKHDRITKDIKLKIDSYRIAKGDDTGLVQDILQHVGILLHIVLIFTIFIIYIYLFRKKLYHNNLLLLLMSIVFLVISLQTYLINQIDVNAPIQLLVLVPSVSMILTIMFDSRIGFYGTIVIALIAGALRGNDYVFVLMNITAGAIAAFTVRDIKNRNQIFRSFVFILLGYVVSIAAFGLEQFSSAKSIAISSAFAASNALISPVLTFGLIIFFEKIFKITTDLTLLELSDFNTPLLKRLAKNTPGTFTHSITVGAMVESAAEAINANPILARVGAYYHDIGKTAEPEAFIENQLNNKNMHTDMSPKQSAEIIIDHVNRGIKLAEDEKLPQEIIDFIPMHHGTQVVKYFLEKFKEANPDVDVDINDFRYPGPKPNTKETALVMLADACESTVRSMDELDEEKVRNVVNNLIKQRVEGGQLDNSPLTLEDISKIKETFHNILLGQHHRRIRYPKQEELEKASEENDK